MSSYRSAAGAASHALRAGKRRLPRMPRRG